MGEETTHGLAFGSLRELFSTIPDQPRRSAQCIRGVSISSRTLSSPFSASSSS